MKGFIAAFLISGVVRRLEPAASNWHQFWTFLMLYGAILLVADEL